MKRKAILPIAAALGAGLASTLLGACGPSESVCYDEPENRACVRSRGLFRRINWSRYDAVVFGETHAIGFTLIGEDDLYLTKLLPELYDNGYRYLAVELDSSLQDKIDKYATGEMAKKEFIDATGLAEAMAEEYWSLIDAAIELGMRVVAISEYPGYPDDLVETWDEREERTEENIAAIYKSDPYARVVLFYGGAHADKRERRRIRPSSGSFTGKWMTPLAYRLEHNLGLETFSLSFAGEYATGEFDLIIDLNLDND